MDLDSLKQIIEAPHGGNPRQVEERLGLPQFSILDFSSNISPFGMPEPIRLASIHSLVDAELYPDSDSGALVERLATALSLPPAWIVPGNGAADLIHRVMSALYFSQPEGRRTIILPEPTFSEYHTAAVVAGLSVLPYALKREKQFAIQEDLLDLIDDQVCAVMVCQPNNPTGGLCDPELLDELVNRCARANTYLLVDECFLDLLSKPLFQRYSLQDRLRECRQLIILRSFTKTWGMPGIRLGYALLSDPDLTTELKKRMPPWSVSSQAQRAGIAALESGDHLERIRGWLTPEREWLAKELRSRGMLDVDGSVNYLFFNCPNEHYLREKMLLTFTPVLIRGCANFRGLTNEDYRVAVRFRHENLALLRALDEALAICPVNFDPVGRNLSSAAELQAVRSTAPDSPSGEWRNKGKALMVVGTTSNAGKSFVVAALCRLFRRLGYKTAPFKAQNMASNSAITDTGAEIGRAQAMQAEAAGIQPTADMNPILLKPSSDTGSQVIVNGQFWRDMTAQEYYQNKKDLWSIVLSAFKRLQADHDLIIVEGAGSPAEINLRDNDFVNLGLAERLGIPCLLVGDIDRGGVFASLYGTTQLVSAQERSLIQGLVINKFRGDKRLLDSGLRQIEGLTGIPVAGVLPMADITLDDEDSLSDQLQSKGGAATGDMVDIAVIRFPRIMNFTDFSPFTYHENINLRYVGRVAELGKPNIIILPGTRNVLSDLGWMRENGLEDAVVELHKKGVKVIGIAGGCRMLARTLSDPTGARLKRDESLHGMNLLACDMELQPLNVGKPVTAKLCDAKEFTDIDADICFSGYPTRMGMIKKETDQLRPLFQLSNGESDGLYDREKGCFATGLHGCFDAPGAVENWLRLLGLKQAALVVKEEGKDLSEHKEIQYEKLADLMESHMDLSLLSAITGLPISKREDEVTCD